MQHGFICTKTPAFDSFLPAGTRAGQRGPAPAQSELGWSGSTTCWKNADTNQYMTMKNALNQQPTVAVSIEAGLSQPLAEQPATDFPGDLAARQRPIRDYHPATPPATRELRSPEAETFRAFLKSRMPREKASQALLHKIRQIGKTPA